MHRCANYVAKMHTACMYILVHLNLCNSTILHGYTASVKEPIAKDVRFIVSTKVYIILCL